VAQAARQRRGVHALALARMGVALPATAWLLAGTPAELGRPDALAWVAVLLLLGLLPPPPWAGPGLSVAFAVQVALAMLYDPPLAGAIAFLGALDPLGLRRRPLAAWAGGGLALVTVLAGSVVFHTLAVPDDPWSRLLPAFAACAGLMWLAEVAAATATAAIQAGTPPRQALARMNAASPYRFPATFPGMGWFGLPVARLYLAEGFWLVLLLLGLLLYARTMCLKAWTQRNRLADLLERERRVGAELRELNRSKGQFLAVASHEVRTPLTAILGYVATLRRRPIDDPATRDRFLEIIERQTQRLLGLVETLLTAAKLESGRVATRFDWASVEDVCREVVEGLGEDRARVRLDLPPALPPLLTDRRCLGQVLGNLLENAVKYSPPQRPCELGVRPNGDRLVLWVRDHGAGIPESEVDRIFDRFYQVDGSDTRPATGIGLGLHLVRELVAVLGGTVQVDTRPGAGSRFTVVLPVLHPTATAPPLAAGAGDRETRASQP
jgi:signal transduction histidine kinase